MEENLRKAWTDIIVADELDEHLEDLGQAKVNAEIVDEMISDFQLPNGSKILMPGCGTGQIFDYLSTEIFCSHKLFFSDINQSFLDKLSERLSNSQIRDFRCYIDDIESTKISEDFDGVIPVLVLEQLEWEKAAKTLINYHPQYIYLIIQEQNQSTDTITVNVRSRESIRRFSEMANPKLVPRNDLIQYFLHNNYWFRKAYEKVVPNKKVMVGLVFEKKLTINPQFVKSR